MKKVGLLLASLGAGLLLVGGTVAAYIVTSADILGARVSPGNLQEDADGHITLSWAQKTVANVSGLEVGTPQQVAEVQLGASSEDVSETDLNAFQGYFSVSIENLSNPGESVPDLVDFLSVKTYKYNSGTSQYDVSPIQTGAGNITAKKGEKYKTTVELLATDGEVDTASVFDVISQQIVYVSFSWGPDSSSAAVENVRTVYFAQPSSYEGSVYFYAYQGTTVNKAFPGVQMTKAYQTVENEVTYDVYAVEFDVSKYSNYNFNLGNHNNEVTVAAPGADTAARKAALDTAPYYKKTGETTYAWAAKPDKKLATYYVRGNIGGINYWDANADSLALVRAENTEYNINGLKLHAGDEIKVYKPNGDTWYGPNDNWVITHDGVYNVYADAEHGDEGGWSNHMYVADVTSYKALLTDVVSGTFGPSASPKPAEVDEQLEVTLSDVAAGKVLSIKIDGMTDPLDFEVETGCALPANKTFASAGNYKMYLKRTGNNYSVWVESIA